MPRLHAAQKPITRITAVARLMVTPSQKLVDCGVNVGGGPEVDVKPYSPSEQARLAGAVEIGAAFRMLWGE